MRKSAFAVALRGKADMPFCGCECLLLTQSGHIASKLSAENASEICGYRMLATVAAIAKPAPAPAKIAKAAAMIGAIPAWTIRTSALLVKLRGADRPAGGAPIAWRSLSAIASQGGRPLTRIHITCARAIYRKLGLCLFEWNSALFRKVLHKISINARQPSRLEIRHRLIARNGIPAVVN